MIAVSDVQSHCDRILDAVEQAVVGKREALELVLLGMLADGHVLIEDFPGLAKTLLARSFAAVTDLRFSRIQFTPDLMPADVTGSSIYNQRTAEFDFRPGPVFANLLLGDEINRAPPKTQAALLEAMQERQVTLEGETRQLERPFLVLATQNPIEYEGTYPLPEAQLDRFLLRIGVGYPAREHEWEMLERRRERRVDEVELTPVVDRETVLALQRAIEEVHVAESIGLYMVDVVVGDAREHARAGRREPPRVARAAEALPRPGGAARTRLRHAGGREERRRARARPPAHAQPRAVGAADPRRGRRAGVPGRRADAQGRGRRSHGVTRAATAKLAGYASLGALGLFAGIAAGRAELVVLATPFVLVLAIGLVTGGAPELDVDVRVDSSRVLEGDDVAVEIGLLSTSRVDRLELGLAVPRDVVAEGDTSFGLTLAAGEPTRSHGHAALSAVGCVQGRPRGRGGFRPARALRLRARAARRPPRPRLSARGAAPRDRAPARHPGVRRKPRRAAEGRGDRVRGSPAVPARRPREARELEGDGAPRLARRQRGAPGAKLGDRAAPRLVLRGAARGCRNARPGGARDHRRSPTRTCGAAIRSGC